MKYFLINYSLVVAIVLTVILTMGISIGLIKGLTLREIFDKDALNDMWKPLLVISLIVLIVMGLVCYFFIFQTSNK